MWTSILFVLARLFNWSELFSFRRPKPRDLKLIDKITVDCNVNQRLDPSFSDLKREFRNNKAKRMGGDVEELSDSGIEKAGDDASSARTDIVPSSPRVPPDGADNDDIQIDQLRPHNQKHHDQFSISIYPDNKCQPTAANSINNNNTNFVDSNNEDSNKINRIGSQQRQDSLGGQSNNQFSTQHEHHTSVPFSNNTYAAFKKGNVVRGILCPSLTNSFRWVLTKVN